MRISSLVTIKIMLGVNLLAYASGRKKGMDARIQADEDVNKFGRNPIGEGKEEQVCWVGHPALGMDD